MKMADWYRSPTPFDDIFKTECVRHPRMVIPLLREVFPELPADVQIIPDPMNNEHIRPAMDPENEAYQKRYTDYCVKINGRIYHLEAQSTDDGEILFRLVEYDLLLALEKHRYDPTGKRLILDLPKSALICLRKGRPGKMKLDHAEVVIRHGDRQFSYQIPVLKVQAYSREELLEKGLFFLIPFFFLRFEKEIGNKNNDTRIEQEMLLLASEICDAVESGQLSEAEAKELAACTRHLIRYLMRKRDTEDQERMVRTMGGQILDYLFDEELFKKRLDMMAAEVKEKESILEEKDSEIRKKDSILEEKDSEIREKDSEIREKDSEIREKDSEIMLLRAKLKAAGIPY